MPDATQSERDFAEVQAYHERTKHRLTAYAPGPDTLDWDAQPDPLRRYAGATLTELPLPADLVTTPWADLFEPRRVATHVVNRETIGLLFELSFALSTWKQYGPDRWAMRVNPSSGNLHPTEAWLLCLGVSGVNDGVHHYAPREHALEQRAVFTAHEDIAKPAVSLFIALTSIQWREAWKYGERAFRYCQLDAGHAIGALRYAATVLGWQARPVACSTAQLAALLGLDRATDFGLAEFEEPDALFELLPNDLDACEAKPWTWPTPSHWQGLPNRLDHHPMYRWPVIDSVTTATRMHDVPTEVPWSPGGKAFCSVSPACCAGSSFTCTERFAARALPVLPRSTQPAATLIRQRRSAQHFDARARMPVAQLWLLLRTLNCHLALGSDAILGFALLAEFNPLPDGATYRHLFQEAGLIGQVLYLEAEALGLRGTGIGCFFDDALHQLIGLPEPAASAPLQSVYHFTVGMPLLDARIATEPPYSHLLSEREGVDHG